MNYIIWILFITLLLIYCNEEKKDNFKKATILKVTLSAFVAVVTIYSAIKLGNKEEHIFIAFGLTMAVPADYFLQYIKKDITKYRIGIFFFGLMHIFLLLAFYQLFGLNYQALILIVIFLVILTVIQVVEKWNLGKTKYQLSVYTILVTVMAANAITSYLISPSTSTISLALGGLFFFISDIFLGKWGYYKEKFIYLFLNRTVYFIGQMLIAFYLVLLI